jgi:stress response protein YsnF
LVKPKKSKENSEKFIPENDGVAYRNASDHTHDSNQFETGASVYSSPEIVQIIPVVEEDFDLTKKTVIHETTIVKRMTTRTEKIEVPIAYEEVYINNKKLKVYDKEEEGLLSKIKDTVAHSVSTSDDDNIEYHHPPSPSSSSSSTPQSSNGNSKHDQYPNIDNRGDSVVLIEGQENGETEKIVPIWGEAIVVSKRKVKLGEIVIRKRRVVETKKIDIDIRKEKVLVEYPDGFKEETDTTPQEGNKK